MSRLDSHIDEFLQHLRLGIDLGESAGGIALVQGTTILHAETYVDLHESTLERRRTTRRGRRTRQAKQYRLARLRSWVLRQKLPEGSRLPDPYTALDAGKGPSAKFVAALSLLFKKRGYKYDERGLSELSDKEFQEFLETARIPPEAEGLREQIEAEIARRLWELEDKKPEALRKDLEDRLKAALRRKKQARIAEPRQVKEAELERCVQEFGRAVRLPDQTVQRWQQELKGLLNKVIRPARFDNRMRTRCSWCEKDYPPRKAKVRELAYAAVVHNLRVSEGRRIRPLSSEEQRPFFEWWEHRKETKGPSLETIKRTIGKLSPSDARRSKDQKKMASQLYNLLSNDRPPGRVNLCREHLEMAAKGQTMKDANVPWGTLRKRNAPNPMREQRDLRILNRLERLLFHPGRTGEDAWRFGPVMYVNLELPEPDTERAKPGSELQRQERTFRQRLFDEGQGRCLYCGEGIGEQEFDRDHIYPRSRGGPDIWQNLIAACRRCNREKGHQTPYDWLRGGAAWEAFCDRVKVAALPPRKKTILLNQQETFPDGDPTPLARVGARPRAFIASVRALFETYGVPPPELTYRPDVPHVQRIDGRLTTKLRRSWRSHAKGEQSNFPEKNRANLSNHAEDAALVAACPPHTWRDLIFCAERLDLQHDGSGTAQQQRQTGLADSRLAPDWAAYKAKQDRPPLVCVLGNYHGSWKRSIFDQTLWAHSRREPDDARMISHKPLRFLERGGIDPQKHIHGREDVGLVVPELRTKLKAVVGQDLKERSKAIGDEAKRQKQALREEASDLSEKDRKRQSREIDAKARQKREALGADVTKRAREALGGARRVLMYSQKGSDLVIPVRPGSRKQTVHPEAARDGVVLWTEAGKKAEKLHISSLRPWSLVGLKTTDGKTIQRIDPPISGAGRRRKIILRHALLYLPQSGDHPQGWYRVTQATPKGLKVIPEDAITAELKSVLKITEEIRVKERSLGKGELCTLLAWWKERGRR